MKTKQTIASIAAPFVAAFALLALPLAAFAQKMCIGTDCTYPREAVALSPLTTSAFLVIWIAVCIALIISLWKVFQKAGQPGWKAIIPVYNAVILFRIAGLSPWFILLLFVPLVNFIVGIYTYYRLGRAFGKPVWFILGLIIFAPIFLIVLAFDKSTYRGPYYGSVAAGGAAPVPPTPASSSSSAASQSAPMSAPASAPIDTTAESAGPVTPENLK